MILLRALLLVALTLPAVALAANPFDSPLKVRHVRLSPDPQNPAARRQVSCFYYRSIVVKQVDYGEVGAERLSLLPVVSGNATACEERQEVGEYVIPSARWSGYFEGVKADYAFFNAPDGTNGGLGFMVLRLVDRKPVFEDVAQHGMRSIEIHEGALQLLYERVVQSTCSVLAEAPGCAEHISQETGIAAASLSRCAPSYQAAKEAMARGRCTSQSSKKADCLSQELGLLDAQKWNEAPSVVVYEVEVTLKRDSTMITHRSDALACRPAD